MALAYYNEVDEFAARWLDSLIAKGAIADGVVDTRSIIDVDPEDLRGFTQCHFFAGIGGWSLALRLAGWPDDEPVWTGSCPCQPFSSASRGRGGGFGSEKHLWPTWRKLIAASRPGVVFGEQVAAARSWIDQVCDDMEALDYAFGAAILPAYSVGQDHARARIYFVGDTDGYRQSGLPFYAKASGLPRDTGIGDSMVCADGVSASVAILRGFGNAIVPPLAAGFIGAYCECLG